MATHFSSQENTGHSKLPIIIPSVILGILALVYFGGVAFFHYVFMPGTTLDGQDVSLRPASEVAEEKAGSLASYQAHVTGDGVDLTISADQIGLAYDGETYAREAIEGTNPWTWPAAIVNERTVSAESAIVYDRAALITLFEPFKQTSSETAANLGGKAVTYDPAAGSFVLDPATTAQYLDDDALVEAVMQGVSTTQAQIVLGPEQLGDTNDSLHAAMDACNAYLGAATSKLSLDGQDVCEISAETIAGWVVVGDDLSVSLNRDAIVTWVNEAVGSLNTIGSERTFTRADGKQVSVSGGNYGWKISDSGVADALIASLSTGTPQTVEVAFEVRGQVVPGEGGRDWGSRYIDIDLSEQHVRMYGDDGSIIWESDCVTGNTSQGYDTPTGVNQVNDNMQRDATLRGLDYNGDGEPDYISYVSYWIPFVDNLIALHDANWRGSFGGDIYQWNGSHGCVNLPVDKAAELYQLVKVGDVVVVHY